MKLYANRHIYLAELGHEVNVYFTLHLKEGFDEVGDIDVLSVDCGFDKLKERELREYIIDNALIPEDLDWDFAEECGYDLIIKD